MASGSSSSTRRAQRRFTARAVAVGIGVSLLEFWQVVVGKVPLPMDVVDSFPAFQSVAHRVAGIHHEEMGDLVTEDFLWRSFGSNAVRHGHFPLWNPHVFAGYPFVGNLQSAMFSPLVTPYYLLPTATAWSLLFPLRVALGIAGMAFLCRRLGATTAPAIVAGIGYGAGGYLAGWSGWPLADHAAWLPWLLLAVQVLSERVTAVTVVLTALAAAAFVLPGHPETILFGAIIAGLFALHRLAGFGGGPRTSAARLRFAAALFGAASLAVGLWAVQLLPGLEWVQRLSRSYRGVASGHANVGQIVGLVSRDLSGNPNGAGVSAPGGVIYAGMLVVVGAVFAVRSRRRADTILFAVIALIGMLLAFGVPPFFWIAQHLPLLKAVFKQRMTLLPYVALPVLAALGLTAVLQPSGADLGGPPARRGPPPIWSDRMAWMTALAITTGLIVVLLSRAHGAAARVADSLHGPPSTMAFGAMALAVVSPPVVRRVPRRWLAAGLIALATADLVTFGATTFPEVSRAALYPTPAILTRLRALDPGGDRVAKVDQALPENFEIPYGFDSPAGYDYVSADERQFFGVLGKLGVGFQFTSIALLEYPDRRLDLLNVKFLIASDVNFGRDHLLLEPDRFRLVATLDHTEIFENLRALPRQWLVGLAGVRPTPSLTSAVAEVTLLDFDPATQAVVTGHLPNTASNPTGPGASTVGPVGSVTPMAGSAEHEILETRSATPALLVVSQQWYPGWKASVDGRPAALVRADGILDGVVVPPGQHHVVLSYRPASFRIGLVISLASVVIVLLALVGAAAHRWRRRAFT